MNRRGNNRNIHNVHHITIHGRWNDHCVSPVLPRIVQQFSRFSAISVGKCAVFPAIRSNKRTIFNCALCCRIKRNSISRNCCRHSICVNEPPLAVHVALRIPGFKGNTIQRNAAFCVLGVVVSQALMVRRLVAKVPDHFPGVQVDPQLFNLQRHVFIFKTHHRVALNGRGDKQLRLPLRQLIAHNGGRLLGIIPGIQQLAMGVHVTVDLACAVVGHQRQFLLRRQAKPSCHFGVQLAAVNLLIVSDRHVFVQRRMQEQLVSPQLRGQRCRVEANLRQPGVALVVIGHFHIALHQGVVVLAHVREGLAQRRVSLHHGVVRIKHFAIGHAPGQARIR